MSTPVLTPTRPYLVRAIYAWVQDNNLTPYLVVNADENNVLVPRQHVKDGQITLNIAAHAVNGFMIEDNAIYFDARFNGASQSLYVPMRAVLGIYARENGQGLFFDPQEYAEIGDDDQTDLTADDQPKADESRVKKSGLRVLD